MPQYMIVYKQIVFRAACLHEEMHSVFFEEKSDAVDFFVDAWNLHPTVVHIERYEYTGNEYVMLDKKHRDL